ncbi:hypothetical protein BKA64DRAFT_700354 [Cadophora sp. MPI-SDFR-AT-0126]|nr:hypothetical protein BKA64DRAFT_700354 [Leotiomycetes sp. MPI-SDFR-AT-0126]
MDVADLDMVDYQANGMKLEGSKSCEQKLKISACGTFCVLNIIDSREETVRDIRGFRLREFFADSSVYLGYSFGDHNYTECRHCYKDDLKSSMMFKFSVTKVRSGMSIRYHSAPLMQEVLKVINMNTFQDLSDCLLLLKHHAALKNHLRLLQSEKETCDTATVKDLDLLVSGLLSDDEIFSSYGYEELYQNGYITADRIRSFRLAMIDKDINAINDGFIAVDESKDDQKFPALSSSRAVAQETKIPESSPWEQQSSASHTGFADRSLNSDRGDQDLVEETIFDCLESLKSAKNDRFSTAFCRARHKNLSTSDPSRAECLTHNNDFQRHSVLFKTQPVDALQTTRENGHTESIPYTKRHKEILLRLQGRGNDIRDELRTQAVLRLYSESIYRSPELALFMSAANGQHAHVEYILATAQRFADEAGQHSSSFWNYDIKRGIVDGVPSEWSDMTVLMAAAKTGNESIINALLHYGCDVNFQTRRGTALSIAGEIGSAKIMKLLLHAGADLQTALRVHGALCPGEIPVTSTKSQASAIHHLNRAVSIHLNQPGVQVDDHTIRGDSSSTKFHLLHHAFVTEFTRIEDFRQRHMQCHIPDPAPLRWLQDSCLWAIGFDKTRRQAWASGIKVMRRMISGQIPTSLNETIMFLALAKAIAVVRDNYGDGDLDCNARFNEDLGRWELVFSADSANLRKFRQAVSDLWRVELDVPLAEKAINPHPDTLFDIQEMVLKLIREGAPFLSDEGTKPESGRVGLLSSQKQWRLWNEFATNINDRVNRVHQSHHSGGHVLENSFTAATQLKLCPPKVTPSGFIPREARFVNLPHQDFDYRISLLMAGAVFVCVIAFFLELRHAKSEIERCAKSEIKLLRLHTPVMKAALQHVCFLLNDKVVDSLRLSTEWQIDMGFISSFSGLIDHLRTYVIATIEDPLVSGETLSQLSTIHSCWKSSYALQESYRVLEVYLGFKGFVSIVPHIRSPGAYTSDDSSQVSAVQAASRSFGISPGTSGHLPSTPAQYSGSSTVSPSLPTPLPSSTSSSTTWSSSPATTAFPETKEQSRRTFCVECNHDFGKVYNYNKHRNDKHVRVRFYCQVRGCGKSYSRNKPRMEHQAKKH